LNILYIITSDSDLNNYRAKKVFELNNHFDKVVVIAKSGSSSKNVIVTGAYPNPFSLLKRIGMSKLKTKFEKFSYFPDRGILFIKKAFRRIIEIIEHEDMNSRIILLCFTPPHINAFLGYKIKNKFPHSRLIIDWQDLWTYDEYHLQKTAIMFHKRLRKLELKIFKTADVNVVTNEFAADTLIHTFGIPTTKVVPIYHPFDRSELFENMKYKSHPQIRFGFLGHIIKPPKVQFDIVLTALNYCSNNGIDIELNIYGDEQKVTRDFINSKKVNFVKLHKRRSHIESINNLMTNNYLILNLEDLSNTKIIMHGKLSHYLMLKIPIIAFVPTNSFVAELIRRTGAGFIIDNKAKAGKCLLDIINNFNYNDYLNGRKEKEIEKFSWGKISQDWLNIFSTVID
jgi:glycosyltransferase involved in cell wall biosynthesis